MQMAIRKDHTEDMDMMFPTGDRITGMVTISSQFMTSTTSRYHTQIVMAATTIVIMEAITSVAIMGTTSSNIMATSAPQLNIVMLDLHHPHIFSRHLHHPFTTSSRL